MFALIVAAIVACALLLHVYALTDQVRELVRQRDGLADLARKRGEQLIDADLAISYLEYRLDAALPTPKADTAATVVAIESARRPDGAA
jgi:hypothetical protein